MRSLRFFKKKDITKKFGVISPLKQIINEVKFISISNNEEKYNNVIFEMKKHLKYKEVEIFIDEVSSFNNINSLIKILEKEKYYWGSSIFEEHRELIEEAKKSMCTSDFLAYLVGKKTSINDFEKNNFFGNVYENINYEVNVLIIQTKTTLSLETSKKQQIPVNYGFSMFFLYEKKKL